MTGGLWRVSVGIALAAVSLTGPMYGRASAADVDDLPQTVRLMLQCVEVDWSQLQVTSPEQVTLGRTPPAAPAATENTAPPVALSRKPIALGGVGAGAAPAPGATRPAGEDARVDLGTADLLPDVVAIGALNAARRNALVALAGAGGLSAEEWKDRILQERLTFEDMCAVWAQFRREYPQEGESPERTRPVWHGTRDALGLADAGTATLPIPQLFILAEMQLYPGETEGAEKCLKEILTRLETGELAGPRVTKGLLAYRIAQCYKHRGESRSAVEWFMNCAEWGAPTKENAYDVRGEGLVEAARLLREMGQVEEAEEAYRKAIGSTAGWGKAVAMLDLSAVLQGKGSAAEADAMLTELAGGAYGVVAQAVACLSVAQDRLAARDGRRAREWLCQALKIAGAPRDPGTAAQLAGTTRSAKRLLVELARWETEPVRVYPRAVAIRAGGGTAELMAISWCAAPLVRPTAGWLAVEPEGEPEKHDRVTHFRYRVSLVGEPTGSPAADIVVSTDAGQGQVRVPVAVTGMPSVAVAPQHFFFGFVDAGDRPRQEVTVRVPPPFTVEGARSDTGGIEVGEPAHTDNGWRITVVLAPLGPGVLRGTVTVLTDKPGERELRVPVYAHVLASPG